MNRPLMARRIALSAMVGAVYAILTVALAPISYNAVQLRVSEVLCILPFFLPCTAWGLVIGCLLSNLITANLFDIVFGTLATLCAVRVTAWLGKRRHSIANELLACFQPVVFNALIVGAVITAGYEGLNILQHPRVYALNALWVGLGEAGVLYLLGFPLMRWLPGQTFFQKTMNRVNR